jgi:2-amino-4-hydroxy-6-hydroxymethyldihydropteridine diphosphokinase
VHWGPRTLDVDVLVVGDVVSDDPRLTLPHPRAHERGFVLIPWAEVDPDAELPDGRRVAALAGLWAATYAGMDRVERRPNVNLAVHR